jgi:hypothetical protein
MMPAPHPAVSGPSWWALVRRDGMILAMTKRIECATLR